MQDAIAKGYCYDEIACARSKYVNYNVIQKSDFMGFFKNQIMTTNEPASSSSYNPSCSVLNKHGNTLFQYKLIPSMCET